MSAKSEEDHTFFGHQQDLQNFSLLDISKSLTIFLIHYYWRIFNSIDQSYQMSLKYGQYNMCNLQARILQRKNIIRI